MNSLLVPLNTMRLFDLSLTRKYGFMSLVKTTLEIPDPLYRRIKATAALQGKSLREFFTEAAEEKLTRKSDKQVTGWRAVWGKLPKEAAEEMDAIINAPGFREIEPEMWK